jgi:Mg2+ and Co2+ transporter CorA
MDVHLITDGGVRSATVAELPDLLARKEGIVWVDVPVWGTEAEDVLGRVFGMHPMALHDCAVRNRLPKVHAYPDALFIVLHAPEKGVGGHVHYVELDRLVGRDFLVTVHGPLNPAVPLDVALEDTRAVLERIRSGRLRPTTAFDISHAVVSAVTRRMGRFLESLTEDVWELEKRVTAGRYADPEAFLDEMFRARHGLLALRTMAGQSSEIYRRVATLSRFVPESSRPLVHDLVDQFDRIAGLALEERDYLQGVIEFYRARTDTKMTIAAERLAVIAVVTLPITALASVLGMNLIVNESTKVLPLAIALSIMIAMSGVFLAWAKRRGWW